LQNKYCSFATICDVRALRRVIAAPVHSLSALISFQMHQDADALQKLSSPGVLRAEYGKSTHALFYYLRFFPTLSQQQSAPCIYVHVKKCVLNSRTHSTDCECDAESWRSSAILHEQKALGFQFDVNC
jgi:hypothetical protein